MVGIEYDYCKKKQKTNKHNFTQHSVLTGSLSDVSLKQKATEYKQLFINVFDYTSRGFNMTSPSFYTRAYP